MKKVKSNKIYSSIFYSAPCSFPPRRYDVGGFIPFSNAQYIFGIGLIDNMITLGKDLDGHEAGIVLVPSISKMTWRVNNQGVLENIYSSGVKGLRYINNLSFTFDYNQQNLHNSSVSGVMLILKVPLGIDFEKLFYQEWDSIISIEENYSDVYQDVRRKLYGNNTVLIDIPQAHQRIGANKYIIGQEYLPCYNNQYFQHTIKINKEIVLHSDERIVAFVVSYDTSTRTGTGFDPHGILPNDPWNEDTTHAVDMCFIGWISGIVSYDISY